MNSTDDLQEKMATIEQKVGIKRSAYSRIAQVLNSEIGKIPETIGTKVYKLQSRVEFLQLYVANLKILYTLEGQDTKVLLFIFQNLTFMNTIALNSSFRKNIAIGLNISLPTVSRSLNRLIDKGILRLIATDELREEYKAYTNDIYLIDPNIVGKGSFGELKKLRYTMTKEYDLETMELKNSIDIKHTYAGFDDVFTHIDKREVRDIQTTQTNNKNEEIDTLIIEKNGKIEDTESISVQQSTTKVSPQKESLFDLQVEKPKNKIKEVLELEKQKMENLKLELEYTNLYIIKKLIDVGRIDEALKFKEILKDENRR